mgnify:CR=1 FL=1
MQNHLPKIIVIVGPTASGKTDLAIKLAQKFNGEIISADSRQIYKEMDIGTAKPDYEETRKIKHHLIDIKNPDEDYTVAEYKKDAIAAIEKIIKRGKVPVLAGGTGLYVKAVTDNLEIPSVKPNPALRRKLENKIEKNGLESVYRELLELDPEAAYIVDGKNPRRVIRALEIAISTKKPFSAQRKKGKQLFDALKIGMKISDTELQKRIDKRADEMIKNGLLEEVKKLVKKYGERQVAFDAIGYKEMIAFLKKEISLAEAIDSIKKNTRSFAKRQMTWFRKDKEIKWVKDRDEALQLAKKFLNED